ncbi:ARM repeat-containing protein [Gonapodya prolifera JEL478]|uniref:MMS19 nucleotide excision repair protein n=1 Tax=Gonapodya prolifera (strain JEL478) TaxID=1344416 RepID=A0A139A022_GONPJ|nr:ARM repeat-containing protein [Gonapodya prolifera JEL478]|eukprot:KXS10074.1 ARM repeat-containing protein [Gonapodya prolifera JEL478]
MSCVLSEINPSRITSSSASVLLNFYLERLHDQPSVGELAKGLLALLKSDRLTKTEASAIASRIFEEINLQTYQQSVRNNIYRIIELLMQKCGEQLQEDAANFLPAYIQAMDGEKDPRNLVIAFGLVRDILRVFDIGDNAEDVCNVLFAYFPITFKPPPDDPYGITTEDLRDGLRNCLVASPLIADFAIPALLEKLASSNPTAKRDAMDVLALGTLTYPPIAFKPHIQTIWELAKEDIMKAQDNSEEQRQVLSFLRSIAKGFSTNTWSSTSKGEEALSLFLTEALEECLQHLKEPESKLARISGKILTTLIEASDPCCHQVVGVAAPSLFQLLQGELSSTGRNAVVEDLVDFVSGGRILYGSRAEVSNREDVDADSSPFLQHKDLLLDIFSVTAQTPNETGIRITGLRGMVALALSRDLLAEAELRNVIIQLQRFLVDDSEELVSDAALQAVADVCRHVPTLIMQNTIPLLFSEARDLSLTPDRFARTMESIEVIAIETETSANVVLAELLSLFFERVKALSGNESLDDVAMTSLLAILGTIQGILQTRMEHVLNPSYAQTRASAAENDKDPGLAVAEALLEATITAAIARDPSTANQALSDVEIVNNVAEIISTAIRISDVQHSTEFVRRIFATFFGNKLSEFVKNSVQDSQMLRFEPLKRNATESAARVVPILLSAVTAITPATQLPLSSPSDFLYSLSAEAIASPSPRHGACLSKIAAVILNKWDRGGQLSHRVENDICPELETYLDGDGPLVVPALVAYAWLARALVLKSSKLGMKMASKLISVLGNNATSKLGIEALETLLSDSEDVISKQNAAVIKPLYKQKLFTTLLPIINEGIRTASSERIRHNYLVVLSKLIKSAPNHIIIPELAQLLPTLFTSLTYPDEVLQGSVIDIFHLLLAEAASMLTPHISSLIPVLLDLANHRRNPRSMNVRSQSLDCLQAMPASIRYDILHPHVKRVLAQLDSCLDDPKKSVRRVAVACKGRWLFLTKD